MKNLIESLNILEKLKDFFETNKISTLVYLVFLSVCVVIAIHLDLTWGYYLIAITVPALFTKVSMKGIDFVSPTIIGKLKRITINRKLRRLRDYEKELIQKFVDADDTIMTIDKNYKCEGLILRGILIVHDTIVDEVVELEERLKNDQVIVEMDRKSFIKIKNNPELLD